jgi:hypothetical protein
LSEDPFIVDDTEPIQSDRLNAGRIRAIALSRRAEHRRRLWAMTWTVVCGLIAAASLFGGLNSRSIIQLGLSLTAAWLTRKAWLRWRRLPIVDRATTGTRPTDADLAQLSDGSQQADALTRMVDGQPPN